MSFDAGKVHTRLAFLVTALIVGAAHQGLWAVPEATRAQWHVDAVVGEVNTSPVHWRVAYGAREEVLPGRYRVILTMVSASQGSSGGVPRAPEHLPRILECHVDLRSTPDLLRGRDHGVGQDVSGASSAGGGASVHLKPGQRIQGIVSRFGDEWNKGYILGPDWGLSRESPVQASPTSVSSPSSCLQSDGPPRKVPSTGSADAQRTLPRVTSGSLAVNSVALPGRPGFVHSISGRPTGTPNALLIEALWPTLHTWAAFREVQVPFFEHGAGHQTCRPLPLAELVFPSDRATSPRLVIRVLSCRFVARDNRFIMEPPTVSRMDAARNPDAQPGCATDGPAVSEREFDRQLSHTGLTAKGIVRELLKAQQMFCTKANELIAAGVVVAP